MHTTSNKPTDPCISKCPANVISLTLPKTRTLGRHSKESSQRNNPTSEVSVSSSFHCIHFQLQLYCVTLTKERVLTEALCFQLLLQGIPLPKRQAFILHSHMK